MKGSNYFFDMRQIFKFLNLAGSYIAGYVQLKQVGRPAFGAYPLGAEAGAG